MDSQEKVVSQGYRWVAGWCHVCGRETTLPIPYFVRRVEAWNSYDWRHAECRKLWA